jgi:hypothetical protein
MGQRQQMNESQFDEENNGVDQAIASAEAALEQCDRFGFVFAAIDISMALDKLRAIKAQITPH